MCIYAGEARARATKKNWPECSMVFRLGLSTEWACIKICLLRGDIKRPDIELKKRTRGQDEAEQEKKEAKNREE